MKYEIIDGGNCDFCRTRFNKVLSAKETDTNMEHQICSGCIEAWSGRREWFRPVVKAFFNKIILYYIEQPFQSKKHNMRKIINTNNNPTYDKITDFSKTGSWTTHSSDTSIVTFSSDKGENNS